MYYISIIDCADTTSRYVAAFNGTIKLNSPKYSNGGPKSCMYKIVAAHPFTKLNMTCTTKPEKIDLVVSLCHSCVNSCRIQESYIIQWEFHISFNFIQITSDFVDSAGAVGPLLTVGSLGAQGEVYTSISNYFDIVLNNSPDPEQNVIAECTFQSLA